MMSRKFMKILCIILALLMVLTSVTVLVSVFSANALDEASIILSSPRTGENDLETIIPIVIAVIAVVAIVVCVVLPKFRKKQADESVSDD